MQVKVSQRLGHRGRGVTDVMEHSWFADLDWANLANRRCRPPWTPDARLCVSGGYAEESGKVPLA